MRKKVVWVSILVVVVAGIFAFPVVLRAIPPRYVAAYLPAPLQELASPKTESPILPTVAATSNGAALLQLATATAEPTAVSQTNTAPPTLTAVPLQDQPAPTAAPTDTPMPSPTPTNTPVPIPASARIENFYHQFQQWNNCGPATMAMTLSHFGLPLTQSDTAAVLKPNPEDRNVTPQEMAAYVNEQTDLQSITRVNGTQETVKRLIAEGVPVILEIGIEPPGEFRWLGWYGHYLLVVAYDDAAEQFWVYDSWLGTSEVPGENANSNGRALSYEDAATFWPQFNRNYIAVFRPEQETAVTTIIGDNMDDAVMWQNNFDRVRLEAATEPDNAFNWFNLGTVYNELGFYEEAATAFDEARAIGLPWRMMWYQFGPYEAYYEAGRYEDVVLLADVTLEDRPYFEESFYYRGLAHAALGDDAAAVRDIEAAARFNPNFTLATEALNELQAQN